MAQPVVLLSYVGFRDDPSTDDTWADEQEVEALEVAIDAVVAKLDILLIKTRPPVEPPETHTPE